MSTENLHNEDATGKLKELVDKVDIAMVCSYPVNEPFVHAVPKSRQEVDESGNIWFLLSAESETHMKILWRDSTNS